MLRKRNKTSETRNAQKVIVHASAQVHTPKHKNPMRTDDVGERKRRVCYILIECRQQTEKKRGKIFNHQQIESKLNVLIKCWRKWNIFIDFQ